MLHVPAEAMAGKRDVSGMVWKTCCWYTLGRVCSRKSEEAWMPAIRVGTVVILPPNLGHFTRVADDIYGCGPPEAVAKFLEELHKEMKIKIEVHMPGGEPFCHLKRKEDIGKGWKYVHPIGWKALEDNQESAELGRSQRISYTC